MRSWRPLVVLGFRRWRRRAPPQQATGAIRQRRPQFSHPRSEQLNLKSHGSPEHSRRRVPGRSRSYLIRSASESASPWFPDRADGVDVSLGTCLSCRQFRIMLHGCSERFEGSGPRVKSVGTRPCRKWSSPARNRPRMKRPLTELVRRSGGHIFSSLTDVFWSQRDHTAPS